MPRAEPVGALVCVAVDARFLQAGDMAGLRTEAVRAAADGAQVLFVSPGDLGDPFVLAAGLAPRVPGVLLGVRLGLAEDGRHPAMLAREVTSLDLVCGGRSVLCFGPPFDDQLAEAIALCRAMWREGEADERGPALPGAGRRQPARARRRGEPTGRARPDGRRRAACRPLRRRRSARLPGPTTRRWAAWSDA